MPHSNEYVDPASFPHNLSTAYYVLGTASLRNLQIKWKIDTIRRELKSSSPFPFPGLLPFSLPLSLPLSTAQTLMRPQWQFTHKHTPSLIPIAIAPTQPPATPQPLEGRYI